MRCGFPLWFGSGTGVEGSGGRDENEASVSGRDAADEVEKREHVTVAEILRYVRTVFEDADLLDSTPFEAAANPGAWYAWRSYRGRDTKVLAAKTSEKAEAKDGSGTSTPSRPKGPSEWNWEGVWEERVKRVVQASLSEASLYGKSGVGEDDVRFAKLGEEELREVRGLIGVGEVDNTAHGS